MKFQKKILRIEHKDLDENGELKEKMKDTDLIVRVPEDVGLTSSLKNFPTYSLNYELHAQTLTSLSMMGIKYFTTGKYWSFSVISSPIQSHILGLAFLPEMFPCRYRDLSDEFKAAYNIIAKYGREVNPKISPIINKENIDLLEIHERLIKAGLKQFAQL